MNGSTCKSRKEFLKSFSIIKDIGLGGSYVSTEGTDHLSFKILLWSWKFLAPDKTSNSNYD